MLIANPVIKERNKMTERIIKIGAKVKNPLI